MWGHERVPPYALLNNTNLGQDHHSWSCIQRLQRMRQFGVTLEGNENWEAPIGTDGKLCSQTYNVIVMRSPIHRLVSHLVYIASGVSDGTELEFDIAADETADSIFSKWPFLSDNYYVRSLGGASTYKLPFGKITKKHLQRAIQVLHQYDDVFVMGERLTHDVQTRLGWSCPSSLGRHSQLKGGTQGVIEELQQRWPAKDWARLLHQNRFDMKLFEEARKLDAIHRQLLPKDI